MIPQHCWRRLDKFDFDPPKQNTSGGRARAMLRAEEVVAIREMREQGHTCKEVAARFGITISSVIYICKRKMYAWVA